VNRTLDRAAALLLVMLVAAPALGQVALTVGSVRDQQGVPIEGALVSGQTADGKRVATTSDSAGTFALKGTGIVSILITCRYCQQAVVAISGDEPVVAIVRRYQTLAESFPSPSDLENLPYTHAESSIALHPFMLLAQSSAPNPGPSLSDRGLSANGSLVIDNRVSNYDVSDGQSPYVFIPANYQQGASPQSATNAFLYGNPAGGGTVYLQPLLTGSSPQIGTIGSDTIGRAQFGSDASGIVLGSFTNSEESHQRTDLFANLPLPAEQSVDVAAGSEQGRVYQFPGSTFAGSFSFSDATFNDPRALNLYVSATADRGNYALHQDDYPISAAWSDSNFAAGIHTTGAVAGFADLAVRNSTGFYDAQALPARLPRVGAMLSQTRADAGFDAAGQDYAVRAGVAAFWVNYAGGTLGISQPAKTAFLVPSLDAQLFPNGKWSVNVQGSDSFTLPTFVEQYQYAAAQPMPIQFLRNLLFAGALTYTDNARVRITFEQASQSTNGWASGTATSSGFAAVWQVAPLISLRAWTMHVTDTVPLYTGALPYSGAAPTVNALWLTYDNAARVRVDAIYRRDLLDGLPFYHVDGAISGPIVSRLRWYAGVEDWMHRTFVDAGLRFAAR
jgi:hypothetical protein